MANKQGKTTAAEKLDRGLTTFERVLDRVTRGTDRLGR